MGAAVKDLVKHFLIAELVAQPVGAQEDGVALLHVQLEEVAPHLRLRAQGAGNQIFPWVLAGLFRSNIAPGHHANHIISELTAGLQGMGENRTAQRRHTDREHTVCASMDVFYASGMVDRMALADAVAPAALPDSFRMGLFAGAMGNVLTAGLDNAVLPQYAVSLALCLNYTGGLDFTAGKNRLFLRYSRGGWDSNVWSWNIIRWCNRIRRSRCHRRNIAPSQNNSVFLWRRPHRKHRCQQTQAPQEPCCQQAERRLLFEPARQAEYRFR